MIRKFEPNDMDAVVGIWLEASLAAHDFIPAAFWRGKADDMRNIYIPSSRTFVYSEEESSPVLGFISLLDDYIAAVFVSPVSRNRGIGSALVDFVKPYYDTLNLSVYRDNKGALAFYLKQGFTIAGERVDPETGCLEYTMSYRTGR